MVDDRLLLSVDEVSRAGVSVAVCLLFRRRLAHRVEESQRKTRHVKVRAHRKHTPTKPGVSSF